MTTALGVFTLVVTAYLFLRPAEPKARLSPSDIGGIRQLLARHGERDSLGYFDMLRRERSPANLIQAQRDYFGAHTYQRTDREGVFHTEWARG